jgi:hypothetical protein
MNYVIINVIHDQFGRPWHVFRAPLLEGRECLVAKWTGTTKHFRQVAIPIRKGDRYTPEHERQLSYFVIMNAAAHKAQDDLDAETVA